MKRISAAVVLIVLCVTGCSQEIENYAIVGGAALGVSVYLYYKKKGVTYYED